MRLLVTTLEVCWRPRLPQALVLVLLLVLVLHLWAAPGILLRESAAATTATKEHPTVMGAPRCKRLRRHRGAITGRMHPSAAAAATAATAAAGTTTTAASIRSIPLSYHF